MKNTLKNAKEARKTEGDSQFPVEVQFVEIEDEDQIESQAEDSKKISNTGKSVKQGRTVRTKNEVEGDEKRESQAEDSRKISNTGKSVKQGRTMRSMKDIYLREGSLPILSPIPLNRVAPPLSAQKTQASSSAKRPPHGPIAQKSQASSSAKRPGKIHGVWTDKLELLLEKAYNLYSKEQSKWITALHDPKFGALDAFTPQQLSDHFRYLKNNGKLPSQVAGAKANSKSSKSKPCKTDLPKEEGAEEMVSTCLSIIVAPTSSSDKFGQLIEIGGTSAAGTSAGGTSAAGASAAGASAAGASIARNVSKEGLIEILVLLKMVVCKVESLISDQ